jgi:hypothetical protein
VTANTIDEDGQRTARLIFHDVQADLVQVSVSWPSGSREEGKSGLLEPEVFGPYSLTLDTGRVRELTTRSAKSLFKRSEFRLLYTLSRVRDAGVDVAIGTRSKEISGVMGLVEAKGSGLINRGNARTCRRIGGCTRVNGQSIKAVRCICRAKPP